MTYIFNDFLVLPVALLQKPFFDPDRPFYLNYGSIGEVIGHEITHHVDGEFTIVGVMKQCLR